MKEKKFYMAIIGLFIVGIGSFFIYRQQQEARALEFKGYGLAAIENRVDALYNEEKTDIQEDIATEITDLEHIFLELNKKGLSSRSQRHIQELETELLQAKEMAGLQENISNLFREDEAVRRHTSIETIEELQTALVSFEDRTIYYKRNQELLTDARAQVETIEEARERVAQLSSDGVPNEAIDEETLAELEEFLGQIKDEDLKERLLAKIASVRLALEEANTTEEVALEEEEDAAEKELDSVEKLAAAEEEAKETEEALDEEMQEKEGAETVQETTQTSEPANNTPTQTNNVQTPSTNNKTASPAQPKRTPSGSANKQTSKPESNPPSNPASSQNSKPTEPVEQKPVVDRKYTETKVIEEIPYETVIHENNKIAAGEEIVDQEGHSGQVIETYEVTVYSDGTSSKTLLSTEQTKPENRVVTIGTKEPESAAE